MYFEQFASTKNKYHILSLVFKLVIYQCLTFFRGRFRDNEKTFRVHIIQIELRHIFLRISLHNIEELIAKLTKTARPKTGFNPPKSLIAFGGLIVSVFLNMW